MSYVHTAILCTIGLYYHTYFGCVHMWILFTNLTQYFNKPIKTMRGTRVKHVHGSSTETSPECGDCTMQRTITQEVRQKWAAHYCEGRRTPKYQGSWRNRECFRVRVMWCRADHKWLSADQGRRDNCTYGITFHRMRLE